MIIREIFYLSYILLLFLAGCTHKEDLKYTYFSNGEIKEKFIFSTNNIDSSYQYYSYYPNGNLEKKYQVDKNQYVGNYYEFYENKNIKRLIPFDSLGRKNGLSIEYKIDGEVEIVKPFVNNILHGEYTRYIDSNKIIRVLFISNKDIIKCNEIYLNELNAKSYFYYDYINNIFKPIGSISYDSNGIRRQKYCTYLEVVSNDTISFGEELKIDIILHIGYMKDHSIKLFLGEIDSQFNFLDSTNVKLFSSSDNKISIKLNKNQYKKGLNLITGKVRVYKDNIEITQENMAEPFNNIPYIFYNQFVVIK